jgi:hypothetical protein
MKKVIIITFLALSLCSFRCSPVVATNQQSLKDSVDLASSNWILRSIVENQKLRLIVDSLKIVAYQDSLDHCRGLK